MDRIAKMEKELEYIKSRVDSLERRLQEEKQKQAGITTENSGWVRGDIPSGRSYRQEEEIPVAEVAEDLKKDEREPGVIPYKPVSDRTFSQEETPAGTFTENRGNPYSQPQEGVPTYGPVNSNLYGIGQEQTQRQHEEKRKDKITESKIGIYALPIAAVVLILIGIGFLSALAWNVVGDIGKAGIVALMGIVSIAAGAVFGRSDRMKLFKYSMFSLALTIFYADIVLMNFVWYLIPVPVVIILILLWSGINIILSKRYNEKLFYYILETGICIASFLLVDIETSSSAGILFSLLPFCMFGISYYMYTKQFKSGNNIFGITGLILVCFQSMMVNKIYFDSIRLHETSIPYEISKYTMLLVTFAFALFHDKMMIEEGNSSQNTRTAIAKCFIAFFLPFSVHGLFSYMEEWVGAVLAVVICALILKEKRNRGLLTLFIYPAAAFALFNVFEYYWDYGMLAFVVLTAVTYIFYILDDDRIPFVEYIITQCLLAFLWIFVYGLFAIRYVSEALWLGIPLILTEAAIMAYTIKQKRHEDFQITSAFFLLGTMELGYILAHLHAREDEIWITSTMAIIFILLSLTVFYIKKTDDKSVCPYFLAAVFEQVLIGNYLDFEEIPALSVIGTILILTTVLFGYIFDIHKRQSTAKEIAFYILGTFNILFVLSETPIWDMSVLLSLILIAVAASAVALGFKMRRKSFRIYGLVLLIISILKMVLFDWDGGNLWIRVFAFIGAGIICLILSYLYNRLEKNLENEKENEL